MILPLLFSSSPKSAKISCGCSEILDIIWMLRNNENDHRRMFYKYWKKEALEMFFDRHTKGLRAEDMD